VQISLPDLVVTVLAKPPALAAPGDTLKPADTVKNRGAVTAVASTLRYYLSSDQTKDGGDTLLGTRSVASLAAGQTSNANVTLTIPASLALGYYYVLACADDASVRCGNQRSEQLPRFGDHGPDNAAGPGGDSGE
jgi:hypothetical protein